MERAVALKKLRKLLGKQFGYQINPKGATAEERAEAKAASQAEVAEKNRIAELMKARRETILNADAEYQKYVAAYNVARKRCDELTGTMYSHKITVGTANNMFFHVAASGDSWEEVIDIVTKEKAKGHVY